MRESCRCPQRRRQCSRCCTTLSTSSPSSSSTVLHSSSSSASPSSKPRRAFNTPSSTLLSLLATVVASSSPVYAIPLSFLCPGVLCDTPAETIFRRDQEFVDPAYQILESRNNKHRRRERNTIPVRFVEGDDGFWRRVDSYTLYGTTVCSSCTQDTASDSTVSSQATATPTSVASSATATVDILDSLPTGWKPTSNDPKTELILVLSLALAFVIFSFILICLHWRRRVRRKAQEGDIETKISSHDVDEEGEVAGKEARKKKKIWARATLRWKANARYSARQRRSKRNPTMSVRSLVLAETSAVSIRRTVSGQSSITNTPRHSRLSSRRSSITSQITASNLSRDREGTRSSSPPVLYQDSLVQTHLNMPPAYQQQHHSPGFASSSSCSSSEPKYPITYSRPPSPSLIEGPSAHFAHVATDDKSLLRQLSQFASAPPDITTMESSSSAPTWADEELADYESIQNSEPHHTPTAVAEGSLFPTPPRPVTSEKGKMAEYLSYSYSYEQDDICTLEPDPGPSAPPFEESQAMSIADFHASAPPLETPDDDIFVPSAPPVCDDSDEMLEEDTSTEEILDGDQSSDLPVGTGNDFSNDYIALHVNPPLSLPSYTP